jgi:hypothetical protein
MKEAKTLLKKCIYGYRKFLRLRFGEVSDINLGFDWSNKPARYVLINEVIKKYNYQSYLEIGCKNDECFKRIDCRKKVGVDPVLGGTIRKTSDDFFASNKDKFDCIFLDGLHRYAQVKKDILESIEFLNDNGVILVHDCLPNNIELHSIPREQDVWNGDVWKAFVEARTRLDIDSAVCLIDEGVGVIKKRKNSNILRFDGKFDFSKIKFSDFAKNYVTWLRPVEFNDIFKFLEGKT